MIIILVISFKTIFLVYNIFLKPSHHHHYHISLSQASSLFPLNINKMQVSLSGPSDGLSFTIETHNTSGRQRDSADSQHVSISLSCKATIHFKELAYRFHTLLYDKRIWMKIFYSEISQHLSLTLYCKAAKLCRQSELSPSVVRQGYSALIQSTF